MKARENPDLIDGEKPRGKDRIIEFFKRIFRRNFEINNSSKEAI